jgi:hypothetical protein
MGRPVLPFSPEQCLQSARAELNAVEQHLRIGAMPTTDRQERRERQQLSAAFSVAVLQRAITHLERAITLVKRAAPAPVGE